MTQENLIIGGILLLCGVFSFVCGVKDYEWFMDHPKARFMVNLMGRGKARAFYMVLGVLIMAGGALGALGYL